MAGERLNFGRRMTMKHEHDENCPIPCPRVAGEYSPPWPKIEFGGTPGPWDIGNEGNRHYYVALNIPGKKFEIVARMPDGMGGKYIANARLIAASPDLLSTLEWTLEQLKTLTTDDYSHGGDKEIRERLEKTIAQVRGQA
jgi:hypothetical protein